MTELFNQVKLVDIAKQFHSNLKRSHLFILLFKDKDVSTGSMHYDLVLLLRFWLSSIEEGIPTDKFENTPPSEDFSTQADLSRIYLTRKRYQNSSMKTISALEFDDSWKIVNKVFIKCLFIFFSLKYLLLI